MGLTSTTDKEFLTTLKDWLDNQPEIMVLIRYSRAGGNKSFEFYTSFDALSKRLRRLSPGTNVIAYSKPQLPIRGVVDDSFINKCLLDIPDGKEFLVVETVQRTAGPHSWFHEEEGETHEELRETLESSRGMPVAVGEFPPWPDGTRDVISGFVPDEDGVARTGVY